MRTCRFSPSLCLKMATVVLVASAASPGPATADPASAGTPATTTERQSKRISNAPHRTPSLAELRARLNESDRRVALSALHIALTRISDGATYVWRKSGRNLIGTIKPTSAFRNANGQVCRHVIYTLTLGRYHKRVEGIACRGISGRWSLSS